MESKAFVSIRKITFEEAETNLVVVYKKENEEAVYPCKDIEKEIRRKEGRKWIRIK